MEQSCHTQQLKPISQSGELSAAPGHSLVNVSSKNVLLPFELLMRKSLPVASNCRMISNEEGLMLKLSVKKCFSYVMCDGVSRHTFRIMQFL